MSKLKTQKAARRRIRFSYNAPGARLVSVVGNFNDWSPEKHPMARDNEGTWQKTVLLRPGVYEYKFLVDEHWMTDPANNHCRPNGYGTMNNLIDVSPLPEK